jgi:hypothetical protein
MLNTQLSRAPGHTKLIYPRDHLEDCVVILTVRHEDGDVLYHLQYDAQVQYVPPDMFWHHINSPDQHPGLKA